MLTDNLASTTAYLRWIKSGLSLLGIYTQDILLINEFHLRFIKEKPRSIQKNSAFANLNKQQFIGLYLNIYFFIVF